jgi:exosome complex RNA-binding protein Rrp4
MRRIVIPGELVDEQPLHLLDTFIEGNKTYATVVSVYDTDKKTIVPLEGLWYPQQDEVIVGQIEEAKLNTYTVKLDAPYKGLIISKYAETEMANHDYVEAYVKELDKTGTVILSRPRVLNGGKLIKIRPSKVHRLLGKSNTMLAQIISGTGSQIVVGMNGAIWVKGGDVDKAVEAIMRVQEEAHISGLTERIGTMVGAKAAPKQQ